MDDEFNSFEAALDLAVPWPLAVRAVVVAVTIAVLLSRPALLVPGFVMLSALYIGWTYF
ncbi:hypothetical protein BC828DRAFT_381438 [Blastocladiella britannica]|nr:hypothetical protein BC828DRAFT_381438 [Blastocladiella britannica]